MSMKQYTLLLLSCFAYYQTIAQLQTSSVGDIYNFEIGDTFQYRLIASSSCLNQPSSSVTCDIDITCNIIVTNKWAVSDTVYYKFQKDFLQIKSHPYPINTNSITLPFPWPRNKDTAVVANLAKPIFFIYPEMDTCLPGAICWDSVVIDSSKYWAKKQSIKSNYKYSHHRYLADFSDSIGLTYYRNSCECGNYYMHTLTYYHKANGETWGTYSLMVDINEAKKGIELNVFPNPATNQLHITTTDAADKTITIYPIDGLQVAISTTMNTTLDLDISKLSAAVYFIEVQSKDGIGRYKFIKQ